MGAPHQPYNVPMPSWYIVATKDRTIQPELERFVAKRMGATTFETDSRNVPMLSQPEFVLDVIRKAATSVQNREAGVCHWFFAGTGSNLAVGIAAHFARGGARRRDYAHDEVFT